MKRSSFLRVILAAELSGSILSFGAAVVKGASIAPDGIVNAASYLPLGLPNSGIAQGSLFIVMGDGLGPDGIVMTHGTPWPTELGGTRVSVTVNGVTKACYLYYTLARQLSAVLPSSVPVGDGTLTVTYNGESASAPIHVVPTALGIFTWNQAGYGPGIIQNWESPTTMPTNALTEAAHPGQVEIIWGTGLGPIEGDDAGPPPVGNLEADVEVIVGDKIVKPLYAGRTGMGVPAIDQIQFAVPAGVEGCRVPVAVRVNGVVGNYVTMSIAPTGRICSESIDLPQDGLERVLSAGKAKLGTALLELVKMKLSHGGKTAEGTMENASAYFAEFSLLEILSGLGLTGGYTTSHGTCVVYAMRAGDELEIVPDPLYNNRLLDAGAFLTLEGPQGTRQLPSEDGGGNYEEENLGGGIPWGDGEVNPPYLVPGSYVLKGVGGADVGAFQATLNLPPPLNWTNEDQLNDINRAQPLTVTWEGGNDTTERVTVVGVSVDSDKRVSASFVCTEKPSAGTFTVPARVLSSLPASSVWSGEGWPTGMLAIATQPFAETVRFSAPGLDAGFFSYRNWMAKNVVFK